MGVHFSGGPGHLELTGSGDLTTGVVYSRTSTLPAGNWDVRFRRQPAGPRARAERRS